VAGDRASRLNPAGALGATLTPSATAIACHIGPKSSRYGGPVAGRLAIRCAKVRRPKAPAGHSNGGS
jgi:hypothetical protein